MSAKPVSLTSKLLQPEASSDSPAVFTFRSRWKTSLCMLAVDCAALGVAFAVAVLLRHSLSPTYDLAAYLELVPSLVMILAGFALQGLYPGVLVHPAEEMRRIVFSVTAAILISLSSAFLSRDIDLYSRAVFVMIWLSSAPLVLLFRYTARRRFCRLPWWGVSAVVLGSGPVAERVSRTLKDGKWGLHVAGVLTESASSQWPSDLPPVLGSLDSSLPLAGRSCEYAIIAMPQRPSQEIRSTIESCCSGFRHVLLVPDLPGLFSLGIVARQMGTEIGFEVPQRLYHRQPAAMKRCLDFILASSILLVSLPLFILLALCVALSSRGSVFYGQQRYGRDGGTFKALKFRTMVPDADRILSEYLATHPELLFEWQRDHKLKNDPRVTPIGRWMRRLSLDELPQLINVLVGQMSLVGPRPIVQAEIAKYGDCYGLYSRVRPGITGLWQVSGRNNTTYTERVAFDQYYVNNWSLWLDIYILVRTIKTVAIAEGAY